MKRISIFVFLMAAFFALSVSSASAQHGYTVDKQVKLVASKASATSKIPNTLETHTYHLKVGQDKTLSVGLVAGKNITFQVMNKDGESIGEVNGTAWEGQVAAGEYLILVYSVKGAGNYTVNFKLN